MADEIEAKVRVTDAAAFEQALRALGAEYRGDWIETDTFFDHPDERLTQHDTALRLRLRRPRDAAARATGPSVLLTYKGPRKAGRMKVREEHQVAVPDPDAMAEILRNLDYSKRFCYEKRRRTWALQGAEVTLDDIPHLGTFAEVEAPTEADVDRLLDALGFTGAPRITASYMQMLMERLGPRAAGQCVRLDDAGPGRASDCD